MRELPKGWSQVPFEYINEFVSEVVNPSKYPNEEFELYSVPSFPNKRPEIVRGSAIGSTKQVVLPNDVLICKINPHINRVWIVLPAGTIRQIASSEWVVMRSSKFLPEFLQFYFRSPDFRDFINRELTGVGGSLTRTQPKRIAAASIPLAPLNEQHRITSKLEAFFLASNTCIQQLDRSIELLNQFRQTVLSSAVSGRLTARISDNKSSSKKIEFEDSYLSIPRAWKISSVENIVESSRPLCYGVVQPGKEVEGGTPLIRIQDLEKGSVDTDNLRTIGLQIDIDYKRSRVQANDILISLVGTIGRIAIVPPGLEANIARAVARLTCIEGVNPRWVKIWLSCEPVQWWLIKSAREVARKTLNISDLQKIPIAIPSIKEQDEIVHQVENLLSYADRIELKQLSVLDQIKRLSPSILAKAFTGKLVRQIETDQHVAISIEQVHKIKNDARSQLKTEAPVSRPEMKKLTEDYILSIAENIPNKVFSFNEIKEIIPSDYESLKELIFNMLSKKDAKLIQIFDKSTNTIKFKLK